MTSNPLIIRLKVLPHGEGLTLPAPASALAAGADLRAALPDGEPLDLMPGQRAIVPCGFAMALPAGHEAQVRPRSGLAARHGVTVVNAPGTVDAGFRGEIQVILLNTDLREPVRLSRGDRIAQLVVQRVAQARFTEVDDLSASARGAGGLGSTGGWTAAGAGGENR